MSLPINGANDQSTEDLGGRRPVEVALQVGSVWESPSQPGKWRGHVPGYGRLLPLCQTEADAVRMVKAVYARLVERRETSAQQAPGRVVEVIEEPDRRGAGRLALRDLGAGVFRAA